MRSGTVWHESNALFEFPDHEKQLAHAVANESWGRFGCIGLWVNNSAKGPTPGHVYGKHRYAMDVTLDADFIKQVPDLTLRERAKEYGSDPDKHRLARMAYLKDGVRVISVFHSLMGRPPEMVILDYSLIQNFRRISKS